ncbi:MAG: hypothetical protein R3E58_11955 [Phycisphaerae bacterium]
MNPESPTASVTIAATNAMANRGESPVKPFCGVHDRDQTEFGADHRGDAEIGFDRAASDDVVTDILDEAIDAKSDDGGPQQVHRNDAPVDHRKVRFNSDCGKNHADVQHQVQRLTKMAAGILAGSKPLQKQKDRVSGRSGVVVGGGAAIL